MKRFICRKARKEEISERDSSKAEGERVNDREMSDKWKERDVGERERERERESAKARKE